MSVLSDVIDGLVAILEGSAGDSPVTAGKLKVFGGSADFLGARASAEPRPAYIEVGESASDPSLPSDVSGDYRYRARYITVVVAYSDRPHDRLELEAIIADDAEEITQALEEPLNVATVPGWVGNTVTSDREDYENEQGEVDQQHSIFELLVSYREVVS